ncbi:MAG: DUF2892 domain-containing protein [Verrucomicrobiales bacterium]|nr:DUF2892 domain-containing protein [Verrucomicrobiales bacterium]MCP5527657.1 DUF2892 domain-containing protein [Verrucomicrobiales bacterium]
MNRAPLVHHNLGPVDRAVRIVAGALLIAAGLRHGSLWSLLGVVPLATGLIGFCPLYCPFRRRCQASDGCDGRPPAVGTQP